MQKKSGFSQYVPVTFLIGIGFFTMGLMDPLYDSYVTIFLSRYIPYKWVVGLCMSLDNVLAIFLIPLVSAWSDKTRTRIGRRMPWIIVLLPLSALAFAFVPYAAKMSLLILLAALVFLNIFKQSARGPVVALMPDTVPAEYRSEGNGVINTMGNVAAIVGTLFLARLMDVNIVLPVLGAAKDTLAFPAAAVLVVLAAVLLLIFVREKGYAKDEVREKKMPVLRSIRFVLSQKDKSALMVLISLFLWFMGYQGVVPFITEYSILSFDLSSGQGPIAIGVVGISSALAAIPMGYAAGRWGRRRVIRISLTVISALSVCIFLLHTAGTAAGLPSSVLVYIFWGSMFVFGVFWIAVVANSFPMLWQMAASDSIGLYTGLYYTFSQAAAIVSPFFAGLIIDLIGHQGIFLYCAVFFALAFFMMGRVTGGEKNDAPILRPFVNTKKKKV